MKRSDAVNKIYEYFKAYPFFDGLEDKYLKIASDDILDTMEKEGMLPPARLCLRYEYPQLSGWEFDEFCLNEKVSKWESEDEKK